MRAAGGRLLRAEWTGVCRRCGDRPIRETLELEVIIPPGRPRSLEELRDPAVLGRRRAAARELVTDRTIPIDVRERIRRDYLDEPPAPDTIRDEGRPAR